MGYPLPSKNIAKMRPKMVPLTNDFIMPTLSLCKRDQRHVTKKNKKKNKRD